MAKSPDPEITQAAAKREADYPSDITEAKLRESEELYRTLVRTSSDAIIATDLEGNITFVSDQTLRVHGFSDPQEVVGLNAFELIAPLDRERAMENMRKTFKEGKTDRVEYQLLRKDGSVFPGELSASLVRDAAGQPSGFIAATVDISERKRTQQQLHRITDDLVERIKELNCLFNIAKLAQTPGISLEEIMAQTVELLPLAWVYPEQAYARIVFQGREFRTANLQFTSWTQTAPIMVRGEKEGFVEVGYLAELPERDEGPFLREERLLIETVGERLGRDAERMRSEEEVRNNAAYHRELLEMVNDLILVLDENANLKFEAGGTGVLGSLLGYEGGQQVGMSAFDFVHPDDLERVTAAAAKLFQTPGLIIVMECRVRHRDGSWRRLEWTCHNLLNNPMVAGVILSGHDITDRHRMSERLEQLAHCFLGMGVDPFKNIERILECAREIMGAAFTAYSRLREEKLALLTTLSGEEGFQVSDEPQAYLSSRVIGAKGEEPIAIPDIAAGPEKYHDILAERHRISSFLGYPVRIEEENLGCLGFYDQGERLFSEEDVHFAGLLARAIGIEEERLAHDENLKEFIDIAAHELAHPITVVKGYTLTLREMGDKLDDAARSQALDAISRGSERLQQLGRELLDISRIERGRLRMEKTDAAVRPLAETALAEMRDRWEDRVFVLRLSDDLDTIRADSEKIVQVLLILLENAVVHASESPEIELAAELEGTLPTFSVLDRGPGVPERYRERIFDRFVQIGEVDHHSIPGIGLGLYIAREIVSAHGGRIWHEPREGGGSVFRFTTPL